MPLERLDRAPELVGDVQFVGVEQQDDAVHSLREPLQQVADEGRLARGVLAHQQDHRLGIEVWILELRRVKVVELVVLLQRQQLAPIDLLQLADHILHHLLGVLLALQEAEHFAKP